MSNLNGGLSGSGTLRGTLGGGGVPAQDVYWDDILNKPNFAAVATSGSYNDLTDKPTIPAAQVNADWNATSGVAEILNKPTIPAAQVNADWNAASGVAEILNKPTIPTTASQIDYDNTTSGLQADDVQDAITELKSNLTDLETTEITTITLATNVSASKNSIRKINGVVTFDITGQITNLTANTYNNIGTLPEGFRPSETILKAERLEMNKALGYIQINSSTGVISFYATFTGTANIYLSETFVI